MKLAQGSLEISVLRSGREKLSVIFQFIHRIGRRNQTPLLFDHLVIHHYFTFRQIIDLLTASVCSSDLRSTRSIQLFGMYDCLRRYLADSLKRSTDVA